MRSLWLIFLFVGSSITMMGCGDNQSLTITGSSTLSPLVSEAAIRFEQSHPNIRIDVQTGGSSRGIRDVHQGASDVGMASRALKADETDGVVTETVAWDGVAFVVHRDNPIESLTNDQLVAIYTGKTSNWADVGGNDSPIVVSNRAEGRSELDLVTKFLGIAPSDIDADVIDGETQQSIKTVSTNVHSITYTSIGAAQHAAQSGAAIKLLPLENIRASTQTVQSGEFPLARPLLFIIPGGKKSPVVDQFVSYMLSSEVDDITTSLGYVPPNREAN